jgi:hypothetical protein
MRMSKNFNGLSLRESNSSKEVIPNDSSNDLDFEAAPLIPA